MAFDDSTDAPREFFKPKNYKDAHAFLVEVKRDAPKSPGYKGELKDAVYVDLTIFETEEQLAALEPGKVFTNQRIDNSKLQRTLREEVGVGNESVRRLGQWTPPDGGNAIWVWRRVPADVREAVIKYYEKREAELAGLADDDSVPDFLK